MRSRSLWDQLFGQWPVKMLALAAAVMIFVLNRMNNLEERIFSLPLEVILPEGYVIAEPLRDQVIVSVKGEVEGDIRASTPSEYRAYVDLTPYDREGRFTLPVRYGRRDDLEPATTFIDRVEPQTVVVTLEPVAEKMLPVEARVSGEPEKGYFLAEYTVTPSLVRIKGPRSRVDQVDQISTQEVSLIGITGDYKRRVNLVQDDPLLTLVGVSNVEFYGAIRKTVMTRDFRDVPIVLVGADPDYEWEFRPQYGGLRLRGNELDLGGEVKGLALVVNTESITPGGQIRAKPQPDVPEGVSILEFYPSEVIIVSTRKENR